MRKQMLILIMVLVLAGFTAACSGQKAASEGKSSGSGERVAKVSGSTASKAGGTSASVSKAAPQMMAEDSGSGADQATGFSGGAGKSGQIVPQPPTGAVPPLPEDGVPGSTKVIKNINLEIRIDRGQFQRQFARASLLAEQFQGYVTGSQVTRSKDGELASGSLTIRVPSSRFEEVVDRLKGLGEVTGEDRSGQDVSREFVDLEARLKQAKTEEAFFLRLLGEAKTVGDMIQVQSQLSGTQLRIEEIQGQLQYFKDQTSYSTITASIYEPGAALAGEPKPLTKAWQEAGRGFQSVISGAVVGLGWLAPFALVGLVGLLAYRRFRRRPEPSI